MTTQQELSAIKQLSKLHFFAIWFMLNFLAVLSMLTIVFIENEFINLIQLIVFILNIFVATAVFIIWNSQQIVDRQNILRLTGYAVTSLAASMILIGIISIPFALFLFALSQS